MNRLRDVADSRGGVFTSAEALRLGVDDSTLSRMTRRGAVVRVRRDAYVLVESWTSASPEGRLALRTRAVLRTRGVDLASHQSALALHGLPLHDVDLDAVDLLSARVSRVRLAGGLRLHPGGDVGVVVADGYRCVPLETALAQVAARSGAAVAIVPLDHAVHHGRVSLDRVLAAGSWQGPRLGRIAADLARLTDGRSESVGETRTRLALVDAGLSVRSQVEVRSPLGDLAGRVDLLVSDRVVVEFDGLVKYGGADGREALVAEKRREDALRSLGYVVIRVVWADLDRPAALVARVRRAMAGLSAPDVATHAS
ncbi:MAG: type IV toxin-antitoxin system AbiEi family antitoxin domain-containing protein [Dermatophilaceae bacterium]